MEQSIWEPEPVEKLVRQAQANLAVLSGNDTLRALRSGSPLQYGSGTSPLQYGSGSPLQYGSRTHLTRSTVPCDCKAGLESLRGEVDVHLYKFGTIATEVTRGLADIRKEFAALKGDVVRLEDYIVHESHQNAEAFQSLSDQHAESLRDRAHEADTRCDGEFSLQTIAVQRKLQGDLGLSSAGILRRAEEEASYVEEQVLRKVASVQEKLEAQLAALEALPERWLAEHEDQLAVQLDRRMRRDREIPAEAILQMHEEMGARMHEAEQRLCAAVSWTEELAGSLKDICESSRNDAEGVAFDATNRQLETFKGDLLENVKVLCESSVQSSIRALPAPQEDVSAGKQEIVKAVDKRQEILETKLRADLQVLQRLLAEQIKEVDTKLRSFEQQLTHRVDELVTFCCAVKERLECDSTVAAKDLGDAHESKQNRK